MYSHIVERMSIMDYWSSPVAKVRVADACLGDTDWVADAREVDDCDCRHAMSWPTTKTAMRTTHGRLRVSPKTRRKARRRSRRT